MGYHDQESSQAGALLHELLYMHHRQLGPLPLGESNEFVEMSLLGAEDEQNQPGLVSISNALQPTHSQLATSPNGQRQTSPNMDDMHGPRDDPRRVVDQHPSGMPTPESGTGQSKTFSPSLQELAARRSSVGAGQSTGKESVLTRMSMSIRQAATPQTFEVRV